VKRAASAGTSRQNSWRRLLACRVEARLDTSSDAGGSASQISPRQHVDRRCRRSLRWGGPPGPRRAPRPGFSPLRLLCAAPEADQGVDRGPGGPPHLALARPNPALPSRDQLALRSRDREGAVLPLHPHSAPASVARASVRGAGPQACGVDTRVDALCLLDAWAILNRAAPRHLRPGAFSPRGEGVS
jgi:hypothetical protein